MQKHVTAPAARWEATARGRTRGQGREREQCIRWEQQLRGDEEGESARAHAGDYKQGIRATQPRSFGKGKGASAQKVGRLKR